MPQYTTFRSGLGHLPVFTGIVELAGITFTGEPAKNKKQAEKNAAMAAWSSLKQCKWLANLLSEKLTAICGNTWMFTSICPLNIHMHRLQSQYLSPASFPNFSHLHKACGQ